MEEGKGNFLLVVHYKNTESYDLNIMTPDSGL